MASLKTIRLRFSAPVHFGQGRLSDGGYTCDAGMLFSALFIEALHMGREADLLAAVDTGELLLSDAFPYIGNDFYLPKPMASRHAIEDANLVRDSIAKKAAKNLSFIRCSKYQAFLDGQLDPTEELRLFKDGLGVPFLQTKVNLAREHKDEAEPYRVGGYRYYPDSGIYFMVQGNYNLDPLLEQLQYSGIGGERSAGFGRFTYDISNNNPLSSARSKTMAVGKGPMGQVLLATATPSEAELSDRLLENARYKLIRRGGFVLSSSHSQTPQKKRDLYCFASGSMFQHTFEGDVFNVNTTPGAHPVYHYAKALWMEV